VLAWTYGGEQTEFLKKNSAFAAENSYQLSEPNRLECYLTFLVTPDAMQVFAVELTYITKASHA